MAIFTGTQTEFRKYIGPNLRNLVQRITRAHKDQVGSCEHCGSTDTLEAAHIHGRERNALIDLILNNYVSGEVFAVDLAEFEESFKSEHEPVEKSILALCRPCHSKYDSKQQTEREQPQTTRGDILPVTLSHSPPSAFKNELLQSKLAEIQIVYSNGTIEARPWKAQRFKSTSNVLRNLRSRPEFRSGEWQKRGIVKVHVKVIENA